MRKYLYRHWADSTLILAIFMIVLLLSSFSTLPWVVLLIWLQFPVYLIHEFEEHVYPGKFREFVNREVFHSNRADFPLTIPAVFWINILAIWVLFPLSAILAQNISPAFGLLLPIFGLFNASLHILMLLVKRKYNPGVIISILLNYPTGIYTLYVLDKDGFISGTGLSIAIAITALAHAVIILSVLNVRKRERNQGQENLKLF
jgi:hypothetical protein